MEHSSKKLLDQREPIGYLLSRIFKTQVILNKYERMKNNDYNQQNAKAER